MKHSGMREGILTAGFMPGDIEIYGSQVLMQDFS